ncbi:unnamed protein product [Closterium sp. Naga37s-1]|nr:unnamed protein product [Closterium sp. Naga37s-1]
MTSQVIVLDRAFLVAKGYKFHEFALPPGLAIDTTAKQVALVYNTLPNDTAPFKPADDGIEFMPYFTGLDIVAYPPVATPGAAFSKTLQVTAPAGPLRSPSADASAHTCAHACAHTCARTCAHTCSHTCAHTRANRSPLCSAPISRKAPPPSSCADSSPRQPQHNRPRKQQQLRQRREQRKYRQYPDQQRKQQQQQQQQQRRHECCRIYRGRGRSIDIHRFDCSARLVVAALEETEAARSHGSRGGKGGESRDGAYRRESHSRRWLAANKGEAGKRNVLTGV